MTLSASVILCTKGRREEPEHFLESLARQSRRPEEVIVVDGAADSRVAKVAQRFTGHFSSLKYMTVKGDLTVARNAGVQSASSDILFFLDDDLLLDKDFVKEILDVFEKDESRKIGGVCGTITNYATPSGIRRWINRLLFLPSDGDGSFRLSGAATWVYAKSETRFVHFLPGGLSAYRKEVFVAEQFDETLPSFGFTDDVDFSYRVSRTFKNFYTPRARALHARPESDRAMRLDILKTWIWAYWHTFLKNRKKQWAGYPALCLLSLGFALKFLETNLRTVFKGAS